MTSQRSGAHLGGSLHTTSSHLTSLHLNPTTLSSYQRHWQVDSQLKTVNASYYSLEDTAAEAILGPAPPGVVRAVSPLTRWVFRANKDGVSTDITCETTVDSRGGIPAMLVNYIQKGWPTKALRAFYQLVLSKKVEPLDELLLW